MATYRGQIHLVQRFSSRNALSFFCSMGDRGYTLVSLGLEPSKSSIAWSQCWCSGRVSKSSLANTDLKPQVYRGSGAVAACISMLQQAPLAKYWEVIAEACMASSEGWRSSLVMNSQSPSSQSHLLVSHEVSRSSLLLSKSGVGLAQQYSRAQTSCLLFKACSFYSIWHPLQ